MMSHKSVCIRLRAVLRWQMGSGGKRQAPTPLAPTFTDLLVFKCMSKDIDIDWEFFPTSLVYVFISLSHFHRAVDFAMCLRRSLAAAAVSIVHGAVVYHL